MQQRERRAYKRRPIVKSCYLSGATTEILDAGRDQRSSRWEATTEARRGYLVQPPPSECGAMNHRVGYRKTHKCLRPINS
eukprot:jgi/Mesvir1/7461/Mv25814-RA.1